MVRSEVAATASKVHGAHHGQDSFLLSCTFATVLKSLPKPPGSVEKKPARARQKQGHIIMVKFSLMNAW